MSIRQSLPLLACLIASPVVAEPPKMFQRLFSAKPIQSSVASGKQLQAEDGPWMILAHTFVGPNSHEKAERLAIELQKSLSLPTFIYREQFDFTQGPNLDRSESRRVRYVNPHRYEAYAVLVGEYDGAEHANVDRDLQAIKSAEPSIFQDKVVMEEETNTLNPVTAIKAAHRKWVAQRKVGQKGPMKNAFLTRNPILPPDYFQSPSVDSFVESMNRDVPHSLLDCDGKFTVIVRTFEGYGLIANGKFEDRFKPSIARLDKCAEDAAKMTAALRAKGVEAYQFHDRDKSIVTVGSFANLGRELPDGQFEYTNEIRQIVNQYQAFNVRPELASQVPLGQDGVAANNIANIPFDVQPVPISVPKRSKKSMLSRAFQR